MIDRLAQIGAFAAARPQRLFALLVIYLALHAAARLWLLPSGLGYDDAEQVLSAQGWAWTYRWEQPPLVTWLLLTLRDGLGLAPDLPALTLLRTAMLAALYLFTYIAATKWLEDRRLAALAAASLSATYTFGWLAHGDLPHSTLLAVFVAAVLWAWRHLLKRPTLVRTAVFGTVCGLGLLAKWNFVILLGGFLFVGLVRPQVRPLVLSWRTPLVAAIVLAIAGPTAWWVVSHHPEVALLTDGVLGPADDAGSWRRWGAGLAALGVSALAFPQPFLVLALLLLWPARQWPKPEVADLVSLIAVVLALHALLVPVAGATSFPERWMIVPLLPLPILVFAAVRPAHRRIDAFAGALVLLALAVLLLRVGIGMTDAAYCGKCRPRLPGPAFAEALREAGFERGTIVTFDMHLAGNLARHFDEARVVVPRLPRAAWPPPGDGRCAVVWRGGGAPPADLAALGQDFGVDWREAATTTVQAPILGHATRMQTMSFQLIAGGGTCR